MNLLMISGDRSILSGKKGAFAATLEGLSKEFERIDVITPKCDKGQGTGDKKEVVTCHMSHVPSNVFFHDSSRGLWYQPWWIFKKGKELVSQHHHDVMTVHEYPPFYNGKGAWMLHRAMGIPYALEIHHVIGYPRAAGFFESIGYVLSRLFLALDARGAKAVRTVNGTVSDLLIWFGIPKSKIALVPSFYLDADALRGVHKRAQKYDIVFAGRLVPNKGLQELLRAVALIPNATLLLLGDGMERKKSEAEAKKLGITDRVTFAGWQNSQQELWSAMTSAKVAVMCSKSEGGPRVALEAMGIGLPLVTTYVGVMPDVVQDLENGVFTTGTPEDLAQKISMLLADESLRAKISAAAPKVLEQFDGKARLKAYADFLKGLAESVSISTPSASPEVFGTSAE